MERFLIKRKKKKEIRYMKEVKSFQSFTKKKWISNLSRRLYPYLKRSCSNVCSVNRTSVIMTTLNTYSLRSVVM